MAEINDIASYIWRRSKDYNVNPAMALGIAKSEGLNPNTIGSPSFGNRDNKGFSYGPFQLYSGSTDPTKVVPGGMAHEFQQKYGAIPSAENWQQQVDFSLDRMANKGTSDWYAVRDRGGIGNITKIGEKYAGELGLSGDQAAAPAGYTAPWSNAASTIGNLDQKYLNGGLGFISSPITGLLGMFGQAPSMPQIAPTPAGGGGRVPDIIAPVAGGDARLQQASAMTPDAAKTISGLAGLGSSLMAAGQGTPSWQTGAAAPVTRGKWRDDIFSGLLSPQAWG